MIKPAIHSMLFYFNLQWQIAIMKDTLMRYKIFILFTVLLLAPTLNSILWVFTLPTNNLLAINCHSTALFISMIIYQGSGLLWLSMQRAFGKAPWKNYFLALPISDQQKMLNDLLILLFMNYVLWIPLVLSFLHYFKIYHPALVLEKCLLNIVLILLIQIIWLNNHRKKILLVIVFDLIVAYQQILLIAAALQPIILSLFALLSIILIYQCYSISEKKNIAQTKLHHNKQASFKKNSRYLEFAKIQFKNLVSINHTELFILFVIVSMMLLISFMFFYAMPQCKLLIQINLYTPLITALIFSNLFTKLYINRTHYDEYLHALPMSRFYIFKSDALLVGLCALPCQIALFLGSIIVIPSNRLLILITHLLIPYTYLIATYFPQILYKRYGFIISLCMMPIFIMLDYFLLRTL